MPTLDPRLTARFELLGRETSNVASYRIDSAFTTSTDAFEFVLVDSDPTKLRGLELQPVELLLSTGRVSGASQCIGRVDVTEQGGVMRTVTCRGRDFVADMVECHLDPGFKVAKDANLADAILGAGQPCGVTAVVSTSDIATRSVRTGKTPSGAGAGRDFREIKLDELKPSSGLGIYEWCNRIAARNGCTIQPGPARGVLCLAAPDYAQSPLFSIRRTTDRIRGTHNNVLEAHATRDYSTFPTFLLFSGKKFDPSSTSKAAPLARDSVAVAEALNAELSSILGGTVHRGRVKAEQESGDAPKLYRLLYQEDSESKNPEQVEALAIRAYGERLKSTLVYSVTLRGFDDPDSGALYACNTTIAVKDEIADIDETMWISQRSFSWDPQQGPQTKLECWRLGAFQVGA